MTRTILLAAATLSTLLPGDAWACASCACGDPTLTTAGLEKPFAGRVRIGTTFRYRWSGTERAPGWQELEDRYQLDLSVIGAVTDRIVLSAVIPLGVAGVREADLSWQRAIAPGDLGLDARFVVLRDSATAPKHLGGVTTGIDLPTGPRVEAEGAFLPSQVGGGSFVPRVGLWYAGFLGPWSLFAQAQARFPVPGWDGIRPGLGGTGGLAVQGSPHPRVALRAAVDVRLLDQDRREDVAIAESGGWMIAAAPSLVVSPGQDVVLFAGVRLPMAQAAGNGEREGVSPEVGLVVDI